jgi:hypothetical protein
MAFRLSILTNAGWRDVPGVTDVTTVPTVSPERVTISDFLPEPTIRPEVLGATAYRWAPGAFTQDDLPAAQPWTPRSAR